VRNFQSIASRIVLWPLEGRQFLPRSGGNSPPDFVPHIIRKQLSRHFRSPPGSPFEPSEEILHIDKKSHARLIKQFEDTPLSFTVMVEVLYIIYIIYS
jgi:hypothetical protein